MRRAISPIVATCLILPFSAFGEALPSAYRLSFDAGYNSLVYTESFPFQPTRGVSNFQQHSLSVGAELLYYLVTSLNKDTARYEGVIAFLGDVSLTALPLQSNLTGISATVLRINGRLGWAVPLPRNPFSLNLMAGVYSTNMFVTQNRFGFTNLIGPQIYPVLHWASYSENFVPLIVSLFFKFSPITDGRSPLSVSNREVSAGATFRIPVKDRFDFLKHGYEKALTFKFVYARLDHVFSDVRQVAVASESLTFTFGYDW